MVINTNRHTLQQAFELFLNEAYCVVHQSWKQQVLQERKSLFMRRLKKEVGVLSLKSTNLSIESRGIYGIKLKQQDGLKHRERGLEAG
jgi:hypothetical protein